jgi:hypothetical protein
MTSNPIQFAASSNGDTWLLTKFEDTGIEEVIHRANEPSGGHETRTPVPAFLDLRPLGPEHDALVALLKERMAASASVPRGSRILG